MQVQNGTLQSSHRHRSRSRCRAMACRPCSPEQLPDCKFDKSGHVSADGVACTALPASRAPKGGAVLRVATSGCRCLIFLINAARNYLEGFIRQWALQRLRFIPRRAHPDIVLLLRRQDHGQSLRVDRHNHRVRRRGQEALTSARRARCRSSPEHPTSLDRFATAHRTRCRKSCI